MIKVQYCIPSLYHKKFPV